MERKGAVANKIVRKDEVWLGDLGQSDGSVQGGVRPVLVTSNNRGNARSNVVQVVAITSSLTKSKLPTHVHIAAEDVGFIKDSIIQFEQSFTLNKETRLQYKLFDLPEKYYPLVDRAFEIAHSRSFD
ncbi:type II toxin-antitoxin system PemK/MazF family toxin [Paenibacillus odorifer]|uniref:type II toxin-antitoxin system PemK/MazF family toxin n=1 Tax=Paenibacillus odorifer TaxID=189426 RepID=UPI00096CB7BA|nr:type II toxin-antitoxin system PemK/MazF family toxin [Paenibacillus odorifer]OMD75295.1 hypothetical protein BSK50_19030 [Paenibacillus odorifer]